MTDKKFRAECIKNDYRYYKFFVREKQDGSAILYCQDIDDFSDDNSPNSISVYRFDAKNWEKIKGMLDDPDPIYGFFDRFYFISNVEDWFEGEKFAEFCKENDIEYSKHNTCSIWVCPESKSEYKRLMEFLVEYRGIKVPENYPNPNIARAPKGYWPLYINMRTGTAEEVAGMVTCSTYCTSNVIFTVDGIDGFYMGNYDPLMDDMPGSHATRHLNSLLFELELWKKVEIIEDEDGTRRLINADYHEDVVFPSISVSGFNETNGIEEKYSITLSSFGMINDWTMQDYIDEYKDNPEYSYPDGVMGAIVSKIFDLNNFGIPRAKEIIEHKTDLIIQQEDKAIYYLIGTNLVGKRDAQAQVMDTFFMDGTWIPDDEGVIEKLLSGEDLTRLKFESFDPETVKLINSIQVMERKDAMEIVADQTISYLKYKWKKSLAKEKKKWEKDPIWYAKYVYVRFEINGVERYLYPADIPFDNIPSRAGFMEYVMRDICNDLREHGAHITGTFGMMD